MKKTHTKGPWQVEKGWNGGGFTISSRTSKTRNERGLIADTAHSAFREQEEANARIIAAAPKMLAALLVAKQRLIRATDSDPDYASYTDGRTPLAVIQDAIDEATNHEN